MWNSNDKSERNVFYEIHLKKLLSLSLAAVMALSLAACGQSDTTDDSQSAGQSQEETSTPAPTPTPENGEDISTPDASEPEDSQSGESGGVLVVYYSATGNTEAVAGYIAEGHGRRPVRAGACGAL